MRDDEKDFPDKSSAPLRASSCTSLGQMFEVAFLPANPPAISRFYVRWPGGTNPNEAKGTDLVEAHRNLLLFRLTSIEKLEESPYVRYTQDHFVCIASYEPEPHLQLKRLPETAPCMRSTSDSSSLHGRGEGNSSATRVLPKHRGTTLKKTRTKDRDEEEFVVAELAKVSQISESPKMEAEVCVLRSRVSSDDGDGSWELMKIPIRHNDNEYSDLWYWTTDAVVTFHECICWVDYYRGGILIYDVLKEQPTVSYLRLKINNRPTGASVCQTAPKMYRSLCVTRETENRRHMGKTVLRFVDVARSDKYILAPFELGYGFTINSSTLYSLDSAWVEHISITSQDLWALNTSSDLPHEMLMFPLVDMRNSNVVHFLVSQYVEEEGKEIKRVYVAILDVRRKIVLSVVPYITGCEDKDADMIKEKSHLLQGFVSSKFPMFLKSKPARRFLTIREQARQERELNRGKSSGSGAK